LQAKNRLAGNDPELTEHLKSGFYSVALKTQPHGGMVRLI
jgi:hypothetical protein